MKLDYEGLIVLAAVVRTGSFEAAATALNVTQSAVSQRIKQLEERLGSALIIRGRPSKPTEEGLMLCQHLEYVTLLEEEMFERFSGSGSGSGGTVTVRISVNSDSLATWFPKVIRRLTEETRIRLEVVPDDQEFTEDRLRSGDALAVITSSDKPIPGSSNVPLGAMEYMAVATPDFMQEYFPTGAAGEALSNAPCITFDRKDSLPAQWILLNQSDVPDLDTHFVPSFEGHLLCCKESIGWAMMPTMTVGKLVDKGELCELKPGVRVRVPLFWQMRNQTSQILQTLTEFVESVASDEFARQ